MPRPSQAGALLLGALLLAACGGREAESPVPSGPPQDVKYKVLATTQFSKPYVGKLVRTSVMFLMMPPQVGFRGKYADGWVGVSFSDVEPDPSGQYACQAGGVGATPDLNRMMGGVSVMVPTASGQEFLSAKTGSVYEIIGVLKEDSTTYGGVYTVQTFEVQSFRALAPCKLGESRGAGRRFLLFLRGVLSARIRWSSKPRGKRLVVACRRAKKASLGTSGGEGWRGSSFKPETTLETNPRKMA